MQHYEHLPGVPAWKCALLTPHLDNIASFTTVLTAMFSICLREVWLFQSFLKWSDHVNKKEKNLSFQHTVQLKNHLDLFVGLTQEA